MPERSLAAVCEAYGLGAPIGTVFIARGSMGAVNRITSELHGVRRHWTVKRSYWGHYTDSDIAREVDFTERCRAVGVAGPRSIRRLDSAAPDGAASFVLTLADQPDSDTQYRVLEWLDGTVASANDPSASTTMAGWLAAMHRLAVDPAPRRADPWFTRIDYRWDELAGALTGGEPELADLIRSRLDDLMALTDLVNNVTQHGAIWCHTDIGADNLLWCGDGPWLIDWENSGPLVARQELGSVIRGNPDHGLALYAAYRRAGGPAELSEPSDLATSVAIHLNYLGCQSAVLLDAEHLEQHGFARAAALSAGRTVPTQAELEQLIAGLQDVARSVPIG